jgi:hypothetical protein
MSGLLDARGCLTDAGLAALADASPGTAPAELAQHVAACARCQDRWLRLASPETGKPRLTPQEAARRRWGMTVITLGILLFALVALVVTMGYLTR